MFDKDFFDQLSKKLVKTLPVGVVNACEDLEKNFRSILQSAFAKMDLVTREEFDAQVAVLERTRKKVEALEEIVAQTVKTASKADQKKKS
ncbi:MAG: accessory factor UbiK family protein [Pseudomonadota bacterium]|nr:accessory factor UbiK family protein [Pseudomonadota bacterium]